MGRWEPDARGRLIEAAMELFQERGYARTTVEEIAAHAGLTERTFFRYFSDKREVLFSGSKELEQHVREAIEQADPGLGPLAAVIDALASAASMLQGLRTMSQVRARFALLTEHAELRERELIKMATLARMVTETLHARGVSEPAASMAAEAGIAAFKVGFERWLATKKASEFSAHVRAAMDALQQLSAPRSGSNR